LECFSGWVRQDGRKAIRIDPDFHLSMKEPIYEYGIYKSALSHAQ
jgi:hypothetical protein